MKMILASFLFLLALVACGGGATGGNGGNHCGTSTSSSGPVCAGPPCPAGVFNRCEPATSVVQCCDQHGSAFQACATANGDALLSNACSSCADVDAGPSDVDPSPDTSFVCAYPIDGGSIRCCAFLDGGCP